MHCLEAAGFAVRDLATWPWARFDVDTPLDLALLRLAIRLPGTRLPDGLVTAFLEMATLPGGRSLELPRLEQIGAIVRDREAQLVVAGRIPSGAWAYLETESACRVRCFIEERGMRSARDAVPHSLLADWTERLGAADLVAELATLGDAVILDSRVLMAARGGSSDAAALAPGRGALRLGLPGRSPGRHGVAGRAYRGRCRIVRAVPARRPCPGERRAAHPGRRRLARPVGRTAVRASGC